MRIKTPQNLVSLAEPFIKTDEYCTPFPAFLENAAIKNHITKANALRKCNSSARHQNLRSGTFPSRARSKAFFPAGAGQNLPLRRDWSLSNCDVLSPDFQGRRPVLTLLRQEKVGNFCFLKISRMSCISTSAARFYGFSSNEVRFKGVRARPVGGAGDGVD